MSTTYQRRQHYKKNFKIVETVEYVLNAKHQKTKSLGVLLNRNDAVDTTVSNYQNNFELNINELNNEYKSFCNGQYFQQNTLLSGEELSMSTGL